MEESIERFGRIAPRVEKIDLRRVSHGEILGDANRQDVSLRLLEDGFRVVGQARK